MTSTKSPPWVDLPKKSFERLQIENSTQAAHDIYKQGASWKPSKPYFTSHFFNRIPNQRGFLFAQADVNADQFEERFESFILGEGEQKVEVEIETRVPNAAMFTFNKEDHTLGNLLRAKLAKSDHILFAGYQVPHPLFAVFKLRVQTDGQITPQDAVKQACRDLVNELNALDQEFTKEWELKKIAGAGAGL